MTILIQALIALVFSIIFGTILIIIIGWGRPMREGLAAEVIFLFVTLFLLIWAGGLWITPFGPEIMGVAWIPFLIMGFLLILLFAVLTPTVEKEQTLRDRLYNIQRRSKPANELEREAIEEESKQVLGTAFGFFFWLLVLVLIVLLIIFYTY